VAVIYRITNKKNGKVYVGQTKNTAEHRWRSHICCALRGDVDYPLYRAFRKYGVDGFIFEVLEECPDNMLDEREIAWIAALNSRVNQNGYNQTLGGNGRVMVDRDEILAAVRETPSAHKVAADLGCAVSTVCRVAAAHGVPMDNPGEPSKEIHQFTLSGDYIQTFPSLREAARSFAQTATDAELSKIMPHISKAARGKLKQSRGFQWRYSADVPNPQEGIPQYQADNAKRRVQMFDAETGQLLGEFPSIREAGRVVAGTSGAYRAIQFCLNGEHRTAFGYVWRYA